MEKQTEFVDFRQLSDKNKHMALEIYKERLSDRLEAYTDPDEILEATKDQENFYIWVLMLNGVPVGHLQFLYLSFSRVIFVEYSCISRNAPKETTNIMYPLFFSKLDEMFSDFYVLIELTFFDKKRNQALERLFKKERFSDLGFAYIQPPSETIFPVKGKLIMKDIKLHSGYDINIIIKDIYFNHYGYWYRKKRVYKYILRCLYFIQKCFLINYKNIS
ncbi:MAG: hypothetical protein WC141_10075 [Arcobacteraceae bacterium]